jgi:hypothetical protein
MERGQYVSSTLISIRPLPITKLPRAQRHAATIPTAHATPTNSGDQVDHSRTEPDRSPFDLTKNLATRKETTDGRGWTQIGVSNSVVLVLSEAVRALVIVVDSRTSRCGSTPCTTTRTNYEHEHEMLSEDSGSTRLEEGSR